jgi:HD-like signal output (HDOD) protein
VFDKVLDTAHLDFESYWKHSFRCATLSKLISLTLGNRTKEASFVAGLLHDVGMVLLAMKMPGKQEQVAKLRASQAMNAIDAEDQAFGTNHAEVGYLLGEHWLLPADVTAAIRYHHAPGLDPDPTGLAAITFLANHFCKLDEAQLKNPQFDEQTSEIMKAIGLSETAFGRILNHYAGMASQVTMI